MWPYANGNYKESPECLHKVIAQKFSKDDVMVSYLPQRAEDKHVTKVSGNMAS